MDVLYMPQFRRAEGICLSPAAPTRESGVQPHCSQIGGVPPFSATVPTSHPAAAELSCEGHLRLSC